MSLNYDLSTIPREFWHADEATEEAKTVTNALIWATIAIGIGEITEANWEEFAGRITAYEQAGGAFLQYAPEGSGEIRDRPITADEVHQRVGLKTNVFPKESTAAFKRKLVRIGRER
jgi:hypothetical protein